MDLKKLLTTALWVIAFISIAILFFLYFNLQRAYVYVDAQKLMNGYKGMQDARKDFEAKVGAWRSNLDTLRNGVELKVKEYEMKKDKLTARERELMEELIDSKQEQYLNYEQVIKEKVQSSDQELTAKVLGKVNDYIKRYGKLNGYQIILAATQYGNIVYAQEGMDITEDVLKGLNAEYGK